MKSARCRERKATWSDLYVGSKRVKPVVIESRWWLAGPEAGKGTCRSWPEDADIHS